MIETARLMLPYDRWANEKILKILEFWPEASGRALERFAHVLFAQEVWLLRITGQDYSKLNNPWPSYSVRDCRNKFTVLGRAWEAYLGAAGAGESDRLLTYKNTKGQENRAKVGDILVHAFNHATYHRGQIATALKEAGREVPITDFISYAMEKLPKKD